jgi:hypothetical protein
MSLLKTPSTMLPRTHTSKWLTVALFLLLILYFLATGSYSEYSILPDTTTTTAHPESHDTEVDDLTYVKEVLKKNGVGPEISYASRTIRYIPDAKERKSLTEVDHDLLAEPFQDINIKRLSTLPSAKALELHVKQSPRPDQVDASSLIFGCSTTFERFTNNDTSPMDEWVRWLTDGRGRSNGAGLVLALFNTTQDEIDRTADTLSAVGINATVVASDMTLDMAGRYVALVDMLYNHPSRDSRKFFNLIDDDTFFPAMTQFLKVLRKYNPAKPYYIGTLTERSRWLLEHQAPFAFGGGGILLTAPMAKQITELPCLEKQEDGRYVLDNDQGDRLLYNCLHEYTDTRLTYLPLLHQEDQYGDPSGFYEAGNQPLSLHHYKSWHHYIPGKGHLVVDACGEDCYFQRFQFNDNFILSNGYSVAQYPDGIDFDTGMMECTFELGDEDETMVNLMYSFGSLRPSLNKTGKKKQWVLLDSRREDGYGRVKQVYIKRRGDGRWVGPDEEKPENDSILVLSWIP